jgi:hypothetical protein
VVQNMAQGGGEPLTIKSNTLHRRLKEKHMLVSFDHNRLTTRKTLEGEPRPVLHLRTSALALGV